MTSSRQPGARTLNGRHVLLALLGFFGVVLAVNVVLIYKAESTFGGVDTDDAYRKGLAYNERIAAAEEQAELGWHGNLDYVRNTRHMRLTLTDTSGGPVPGLTVTAQLQRPVTNRYDQELSLTQTGADTYEADVSGLAPGWWTVDVRAHHGPENATLYEARRRLWIRP